MHWGGPGKGLGCKRFHMEGVSAGGPAWFSARIISIYLLIFESTNVIIVIIVKLVMSVLAQNQIRTHT